MSAFLNASMDMVLTWTLPTHYGCPPLPKMAWSLQAVSVSLLPHFCSLDLLPLPASFSSLGYQLVVVSFSLIIFRIQSVPITDIERQLLSQRCKSTRLAN